MEPMLSVPDVHDVEMNRCRGLEEHKASYDEGPMVLCSPFVCKITLLALRYFVRSDLVGFGRV